METSNTRWLVRDKRQLLSAILEGLAGNAHISFEDNLSALRLSGISGASEAETAVLKRGTVWPKQDFVVFPLEPSVAKEILQSLGPSVPKSILHIQVEKAGVLEFAAYDSFHPDCLYLGKAVTENVLESLLSQGVLAPVARGRD